MIFEGLKVCVMNWIPTIIFILCTIYEFLFRGFLGQALTSRNGGVSAAPAGGAASSFGEHASMGKGTYEYDGSKEPQ